ncbi:MAG: putative drug exporter of the superfamily [Streptosporangiaceae bacterium]|jgi:RND superfamily putative drug exporter|nr:putative drug exporter of the superfamily [Streptosporangiaceae bacterium]
MSKARAIVSVPSGRRTKWVVLVLWIVILGVAGPLAGKLMNAEKNDAKSWLPAKAESTKVLDLQSRFQSPNVFPAVVVYNRPSGLTAADRAKAAADAQKFTTISGVVPGQVSGPFFAQDGRAIETVIPVNLGKNGWNAAGPAADAIRGVAQANGAGLAVHITGPLGTAADSAKSFKGINGTLLLGTLAVVILLLLITYRSPVLWLLPVISAGVALASAEALIYLLAVHAGLTVNAQSAGILDVLVFGAGTDYALLLTARYREELRRHEDRHEAMAVALRRAGPAVIASAGTVIVSLLALLVAELNSTKGLGPVLAIGVAVALLAMMTLLPALLVIFGRWIFWPVRPGYGSAEPTSRGIWARVGRGIATRPRVVWVTTAVVLGAMALGLTGLKASGLTNAQAFRGHPDSVTGQTVLDQHFSGGGGQPVVVVGSPSAAAQLAAAFKATPGITGVTPPVTRAGHVYLLGTLTTAPDSQAAYATVDRVRAAVHAVPGADALAGGNTAINLDVQRAAAHDRNLIIPLVLVVVFLILALLLRAVVAPLMLIATVVLSFAAALGVSSLMFNDVFKFGGADTSFPLFVFVFLVALGIDYNIFLMTRVREEATRHGSRRGALTGLAATGGVITSAGAVLAGTFAVLGTLPVTFLTELGFAVAFGVLLDTIVVRSVLVTALNLDLGRWLWWPSRLAGDRSPEAEEATSAGEAAAIR